MKKILLIVIMLTVCRVYGDLIYDDNQEHTLDFVAEFSEEGLVYVRNNTIVNVVDGADISLRLRDNSTAYIQDGILRSMTTSGTSTAYITGGDFYEGGDFYFRGDSTVHIKGGLFGQINLEQNASLIFYGSDFSYTDASGSSYPITSGILTGGPGYYISGILESGDILDDFLVYVGPDASIQFVPEPCTLAMLALGGVLIRKRRAA